MNKSMGSCVSIHWAKAVLASWCGIPGWQPGMNVGGFRVMSQGGIEVASMYSACRERDARSRRVLRLYL